jgi:hypothetical protein
MHHVFDETPDQAMNMEALPLHTASNAIYSHHVGYAKAEPLEQVNQTTLRQRGYKVGSLKTGPNDEDKYYKQPGHPLHPDVEKGGRYKVGSFHIHNYIKLLYYDKYFVRLFSMIRRFKATSSKKSRRNEVIKCIDSVIVLRNIINSTTATFTYDTIPYTIYCLSVILAAIY